MTLPAIKISDERFADWMPDTITIQLGQLYTGTDIGMWSSTELNNISKKLLTFVFPIFSINVCLRFPRKTKLSLSL